MAESTGAPLRVWLDDERDPRDHAADPRAWTWVTTVAEAIAWLQTGRVVELSLDNDLGEDQPEGRMVVMWMAEHDVWPAEGVTVHSQNAVAAERMCQDIEHYSGYRYARRLGGARQFKPRT